VGRLGGRPVLLLLVPDAGVTGLDWDELGLGVPDAGVTGLDRDELGLGVPDAGVTGLDWDELGLGVPSSESVVRDVVFRSVGV